MILSLNIGGNELTGSIPTEVGSLTELMDMFLSKELLCILLLCFEK